MNIKLEYLYRDEANYKDFREVIFPNPDKLSLSYIEEVINKNLIEGQWFYPTKWNLSLVETYQNYMHEFEWYEYDRISNTSETATSTRSITHFLNFISCKNIELNTDPSFDPNTIFLMGEEIPTCPYCGSRTMLLQEFTTLNLVNQNHKCLNKSCSFEFVMQNN